MITPEERQRFEAALDEEAQAIMDAIAATTNPQRIAARDRFKAARRTQFLLALNAAKYGIQNDYT